MASINDVLKNMRTAGKLQNMKDKGDLGEEAVLALCYERKQKLGNGLLFQSFEYPYQSNAEGVCYTGNVLYENEEFVDYSRDTINDEIDILYVTPYRVFVIEVKSYKSKSLDVYEHWFNRNGSPEHKSPIAQAEKHARHLYHAIYDVLPDGDPKYIQPLVCFVDNCRVRDDRSDYYRDYVPVCILNNFLSTLQKYNKPLAYNLALDSIEEKLYMVKSSIKKVL